MTNRPVTMTKIYNEGQWVASRVTTAEGIKYAFDGNENGGRLYRIPVNTYKIKLIAILRAGQCPQERLNTFLATGN